MVGSGSRPPDRMTSGRLRFIAGWLVFALLAGGRVLDRAAAYPVVQSVPSLPQPDHSVIVMEENQNFAAVFGFAAAPCLNSLARHGVVFTNWHGLTHPSQPNYRALFAGTDDGLTDDSCPHRYTGPKLVSAGVAAGRAFSGDAEGLPARGSPARHLLAPLSR